LFVDVLFSLFCTLTPNPLDASSPVTTLAPHQCRTSSWGLDAAFAVSTLMKEMTSLSVGEQFFDEAAVK
jgi:hypothetical protein